MFMRMTGRDVVSLRSLVTKRGLEMIYNRTENSKVEALETLSGDDRRDRVSLRAFDGLLGRLVDAGPQELSRWGGQNCKQRLDRLNAEVQGVERQINQIGAWLEQQGGPVDDGHTAQAAQQLKKML